jgi:uncharacterized membrane protein YsdA (DUF1294 family)/cold shock CspA family protein
LPAGRLRRLSLLRTVITFLLLSNRRGENTDLAGKPYSGDSEEPGEMSVRTKGRITSWNDEKGFGFITPFDGGRQIFIHVSALSNRSRRPELNEVVTYSVTTDKQGRPCAADATLAGDKLTKKAQKKSKKTVMLVSIVFLTAIGASSLTGHLSWILLAGYAALSLVTFVAYAIDKSAAQKGAWRTSEATLLFLGMAGGWPGALMAQEMLRHKSKKTSFRAVFWITVLINLTALAWLQTESGQETVRGLFV